MTILILVITIISLCISPAESRYDWSHLVAQSLMWRWNKIAKIMRMHYHFHFDQWQLQPHYFPSSSSVSSSSESSSSEKIMSRHPETKPFEPQPKPPIASEQQQIANIFGIKIEEEKPHLVAQAFTFFVTNWGCHNVSGLQHFFAAYNSESEEDAVITMNDQHELLREMSSLAQKDLLQASSSTPGNSTTS